MIIRYHFAKVNHRKMGRISSFFRGLFRSKKAGNPDASSKNSDLESVAVMMVKMYERFAISTIQIFDSITFFDTLPNRTETAEQSQDLNSVLQNMCTSFELASNMILDIVSKDDLNTVMQETGESLDLAMNAIQVLLKKTEENKSPKVEDVIHDQKKDVEGSEDNQLAVSPLTKYSDAHHKPRDARFLVSVWLAAHLLVRSTEQVEVSLKSNKDNKEKSQKPTSWFDWLNFAYWTKNSDQPKVNPPAPKDETKDGSSATGADKEGRKRRRSIKNVETNLRVVP